MARIPRSRSRTSTTIGVYMRRDAAGTLTSSTSVTRNRTSQISDRIGRPIVPSPLAATQFKGEVLANWSYRRANGATGQGIAVPLNLNAIGGFTLQAPSIPSGWELTTVARSNPSRPVVYPFEIVESVIQLPRMLKGLLNLLQHPRTVASPKGVANNYLGLQFGWVPLIDDLRKIANCQSYVQKRAKEIQQLYSGKGLRRRVRFSDTTENRVGQELYSDIHPTALTFKGDIQISYKVWATIRWYPTASLPFAGEHDTRYANYLRNLVLGLTPEGMATGAWKIIPWTWLIGWFTNVGDYLMVNSNTVPASYGKACLMRKATAVYKYASHNYVGADDLGTTATGSRTHTLLNRTVGSGVLVPGFNMPFLDMFRLSVLGSLAIQRIR